MTSKIINMADIDRDAEDRLLQSLFEAEPLSDNCFSEQVVRRVRRRLWLKRLSLPIAAAVGASIAVKPLASLARSLGEFVQGSMAALPTPTASLPMLAAASLLTLAFVVFQLIED